MLNTHLSLEIAVAVIGVRLGLLSPAANVNIILFAVLTVFFMPIVFNALVPKPGEQDERSMLIFGAEDLGLQVAHVLQRYAERVRFIDPEPRRIEKARQAGFEAVQVDSINEGLKAANRGTIKALLVLSSDDTRNLLVSHAAREQGLEHIVALVNDPAKLPEFQSLGIKTFTSTLYRPALLALMAHSPDIFTLLTSPTNEQNVREVFLRNPIGAGGQLHALGLPGSLLVLAVGRNGDLIVPHGGTRLELGDRLTILGHPDDLHSAAAWLESDNLATSTR